MAVPMRATLLMTTNDISHLEKLGARTEDGPVKSRGGTLQGREKAPQAELINSPCVSGRTLDGYTHSAVPCELKQRVMSLCWFVSHFDTS